MTEIFRFEKEIFEVLHRKGWNVYHSTTVRTPHDCFEAIRAGPVQTLVLEERYAVLPRADEDKDPEKVYAALEKLAVRLDRNDPTIEIDGERFPWTGFRPRETEVKVNTPVGHYLYYPAFLSALETIVQV